MTTTAATSRQARVTELESDYRLWKLTLFESAFIDSAGRLVPDAKHHHHYWRWIWSLEKNIRPPAYIGVWARGGAKSTNVELGAISLGARQVRRYGWYVSDTQTQADAHVQTIGTLLESRTFGGFYPDMSSRRVGKFGSTRGWRRDRLATRSKFTIDALGLDTARRGVKMDQQRPDFMIFDDIDDYHDSPDMVKRKLDTISRDLIPAGAENLAIMGVQNLIHPDSIFAQLVDGRADILTNRIVSGPIPSLLNYRRIRNDDPKLTTSSGKVRKFTIFGKPTWVGQDLDTCQGIVDDIGPTEFEGENQHQVEAPAGGIYDDIEMDELIVQPEQVPDLTRIVVWVDPAVTKTDSSDSQAIQADGLGSDDKIYRLYSREQRDTPLATIEHALEIAADLQAEHVGIETDQGGDTWESVFVEAQRSTGIKHIPMVDAKAGQGHGPKVARSQRMHTAYELGNILHVDNAGGAVEVLAPALKRFPKTKPLDLADAAYWSWMDLSSGGEIAGDPFGGRSPEEDAAEDRAIKEATRAPRRSALAGRPRSPDPSIEAPKPATDPEIAKLGKKRRKKPAKNPLRKSTPRGGS